jgi:nucleoside-diphosphate-sugar epimerase
LARRAIGFETTVPLEQGLGELVDWWRSERERGGALLTTRVA